MPEYIYVLGMDGKPQMPTIRKRHVQKLLNTGKARIAGHVPYTIQLLYKNNPVTQPLCLGIDPGRTNIGVSVTNVHGDSMFSAVVETRNKEIPKLMADRASHRRASRQGERKARQRLAKRHNTMVASGICMRKLPQYGDDKFIICKSIKNTEARFCNRKRKEGWLTPTANQLLQTHLSVVKKVCRYLPVTDVALEINCFAFMQMENPEVFGIDFQNGPLKGYDDVEAAIDFMQDGKCLMCKNSIEHYHHLVPKSKGGSDTITNIAGLCKCCHEKAHTDATFAGQLNKAKTGQLKKYGALSVLNQIIPYLYRELNVQFGETYFHPVSAKDTAKMRNNLEFVKTTDNPMHEVDAYCVSILASGAEVDAIPQFKELFHIKQFRRHDRAIINNQRERTYKLDGVAVAKNRTPRFEQKGVPALSQWFDEQVETLGLAEAERLRSRLKVERSVRRYNTFPRVLPGAVYLYRGNRCVLGGQQNNGYYYYPYGNRNNRMPAKECAVTGGGGLVFI